MAPARRLRVRLRKRRAQVPRRSADVPARHDPAPWRHDHHLSARVHAGEARRRLVAGDESRLMRAITIKAATWEAIAAGHSLQEPRRSPYGHVYLWLAPAAQKMLEAARGPSEGWDEAIIRWIEEEHIERQKRGTEVDRSDHSRSGRTGSPAVDAQGRRRGEGHDRRGGRSNPPQMAGPVERAAQSQRAARPDRKPKTKSR